MSSRPYPPRKRTRANLNQVLTFESAAACSLVEEHVEEQREAALAALTVELVETFRQIASMAGGSGGGVSGVDGDDKK